MELPGILRNDMSDTDSFRGAVGSPPTRFAFSPHLAWQHRDRPRSLLVQLTAFPEHFLLIPRKGTIQET
jgi:hypothetical protein